MKRKKFYYLVLVFLVLLLLLRSCPSGSSMSTIEANWQGLSFPPSAKWQEVYQTDSGPSFHGDGWRYHVYSYENGEEIPTMVPWSDDLGRTLFKKTYPDACEEWLDILEVPDTMRPDYDACLVWHGTATDNSQILVFWNPENQTLSIAENLI